MPKQTAHPTVDRHIGYRLRRLRQGKGYTQRRLAEVLRVRHQQIQKYESGASRLAASQLVEIARLFNVSLQFFVNGLDPGLAPPAPPVRIVRDAGLHEDAAEYAFAEEGDERDARVAALLHVLDKIRRLSADTLDPVIEETP